MKKSTVMLSLATYLCVSPFSALGHEEYRADSTSFYPHGAVFVPGDGGGYAEKKPFQKYEFYYKGGDGKYRPSFEFDHHRDHYHPKAGIWEPCQIDHRYYRAIQ